MEPDTFAFGNTIVAAAQSGRFFDGGACDIGYATSTDSGATWTHGTLPGITVTGGGGTFERVSDPSVAYDAKHNVWLISSVPITVAVTVPSVFVNRSTDGGLTFGNPVPVRPSATAWTRTGLSATTLRPVPSTATATRSSTTTPTATGSRCRPPPMAD